MKKCILILLSICLIMAMTACGGNNGETTMTESAITETEAETDDEANQFEFTLSNYPKIDGSTATIPLAKALVNTLLGIENAEEHVSFNGTSNAYLNLIHGSADLLVVYEIPDIAQDASANSEVELEFAPIGKDALVFLTHKENPVDNLAKGDLIQIYEGNITNWKELGGDDAPIKAYQRNATSGSQTLMNKLVMDGYTLMPAAPDFLVATMEGLIEVVADFDNNAHSIGYNVYYYVSQMKADDNVKAFAIDNIHPSNDTIRSNEYPFVNDFYAVIRKDEPADSPARILFEFLKSDAGQEIIAKAGYVSNK